MIKNLKKLALKRDSNVNTSRTTVKENTQKTLNISDLFNSSKGIEDMQNTNNNILKKTMNFNLDFSFLRNFFKNFSKFLHIISLNEKVFKEFLAFASILSPKEAMLFQEFVLEKIYFFYKKGLINNNNTISLLNTVTLKNTNNFQFTEYVKVPEEIHLSKDLLIKNLRELKKHG